LLFDEAEQGGLEAALSQLCSDEALRERLAKGALASIHSQQLTWDGNARRVVALVSAPAA
jgi:hypothetical protein